MDLFLHFLLLVYFYFCLELYLFCLFDSIHFIFNLFYFVGFIFAGLIVCCCINLSVAGGVSVMYPTVVFNIPVMILKRLHAMFGALVFIGGMVTVWLGLSSTWFTNSVDNDAILALCFASPLVIMLLVVVQVGQKVLRWKSR